MRGGKGGLGGWGWRGNCSETKKEQNQKKKEEKIRATADWTAHTLHDAISKYSRSW